MNTDPYTLAAKAAAYLSKICPAPKICGVLGSGLGALANTLIDPTRIAYADIPGFHTATVTGHAGELVVGRIFEGGPTVVILAGRVHLYEGHPIVDVVHPLRAMRLWGVKAGVITNAAGGIHPDSQPGDLMLITDHLNLTGQNPLHGPNDARLGVRFPDMSRAYDPEFRTLFMREAGTLGFALRQGVYAGLNGPSYETPAEIRMLRSMGADAVGMSTVNEVIAGHHAGLRLVGISCITNLAAGMSGQALNHAEVKEVATLARKDFLALVKGGMARMDAVL